MGYLATYLPDKIRILNGGDDANRPTTLPALLYFNAEISSVGHLMWIARYIMLPIGITLLAASVCSVFGIGVRADRMFLVALVWQLLVATVNLTQLLMDQVKNRESYGDVP